MSVFKADQSTFCSACGTLLVITTNDTYVACHLCGARRELADFIGTKHTTRSRELELKFARFKISTTAKQEEATIAEECPQCGRPEMTFKTAQLRSADEGQTVFYSCKCGYKFAVNS